MSITIWSPAAIIGRDLTAEISQLLVSDYQNCIKLVKHLCVHADDGKQLKLKIASYLDSHNAINMTIMVISAIKLVIDKTLQFKTALNRLSNY